MWNVLYCIFCDIIRYIFRYIFCNILWCIFCYIFSDIFLDIFCDMFCNIFHSMICYIFICILNIFYYIYSPLFFDIFWALSSYFLQLYKWLIIMSGYDYKSVLTGGRKGTEYETLSPPPTVGEHIAPIGSRGTTP